MSADGTRMRRERRRIGLAHLSLLDHDPPSLIDAVDGGEDGS